MKLETVLNSVRPWAPDRNTTDGVVVGSIVRMVRNLPGYPFPGGALRNHAPLWQQSFCRCSRACAATKPRSAPK